MYLVQGFFVGVRHEPQQRTPASGEGINQAITGKILLLILV